MDLMHLEDLLQRALARFPGSARRDIIRILSPPDEDRARRVGEVCASGRHPQLAELLIDLEEDARLRRWVLVELRRLERDSGVQ